MYYTCSSIWSILCHILLLCVRMYVYMYIDLMNTQSEIKLFMVTLRKCYMLYTVYDAHVMLCAAYDTT